MAITFNAKFSYNVTASEACRLL